MCKRSILTAIAAVMLISFCDTHLRLYQWCLSPNDAAWAQSWQELKGKHFIVNYAQDKKEAQEILYKAGNYYTSIARELGYPRYSDFWTWEKRAKIFIYPDHGSYLKATGRPEWSHGMANYADKTIISYRFGQGFSDTILPHEIAHLVFRDFIGFKSDIPLWLDEGVAQWSEFKNRPGRKREILEEFEHGKLISLWDMMSMNLGAVSKYENVQIRAGVGKGGKSGILFLNAEAVVRVYYFQAFSLVGFMIEKYGSLKFADFCRQLRDGHSLEEAIRRVYAPQMKNLDELETNWINYLEEGAR